MNFPEPMPISEHRGLFNDSVEIHNHLFRHSLRHINNATPTAKNSLANALRIRRRLHKLLGPIGVEILCLDHHVSVDIVAVLTSTFEQRALCRVVWIMREGIHPEYRDVVFQDTSTGIQFLIGSTIKTQKTCEFEGKTLPLVTVDISSASHPFFTGKQKFIDAAGRVEKFQRKYNWGKKEEGEAQK